MDQDPMATRSRLARRLGVITGWLLRRPQRHRERQGELVTISMKVDDAFALRAEAAAAHRDVDEVIALAIGCLRRDTPHTRLIVEPGTSKTDPGVEDLTVSLAEADATWIAARAGASSISLSAVVGEALTHFRVHGPPLERHPEPWTTTVRSRQDIFYRELTRVCEDVAAGRCSSDVADARIGSAFVGRLSDVVPKGAWGELSNAVREFCVNYPPIRAAHRRQT